MSDAPRLPYLTGDLPGTGGTLRGGDDDFRVDEIPAYEPEGRGDHVFVHIEKRGLTTPQAAEALARAAGARIADVGWAGMKDRHAVTRQWLSLPPPCTPEAITALALDGITILAAVRHPHKLRTGHLRGNRFTLAVRGVDGGAALAAGRAEAIAARLARAPGCPNWYGAQRFGAAGDNAACGRELLAAAGDRRPRAGRGRGRNDGRRDRLMISALQSSLFNEYLRRRLADGCYARVLVGDILQKRGGGMFVSTEPAVDQARLDAGEVAPTGPMFGHSMREPPEGSAAAAREAAVLADEGLTPASFRAAGKLAEGTRRALGNDLGEVRVTLGGTDLPADDDTIWVSFTLPAGAYATAVMREIVKPPTADFPD
jgi:tRNA pseudouridine13 synthase